MPFQVSQRKAKVFCSELDVFVFMLQRFSEIAAKHVDNKAQVVVMTECLKTLLKKLSLSRQVSEAWICPGFLFLWFSHSEGRSLNHVSLVDSFSPSGVGTGSRSESVFRENSWGQRYPAEKGQHMCTHLFFPVKSLLSFLRFGLTTVSSWGLFCFETSDCYILVRPTCTTRMRWNWTSSCTTLPTIATSSWRARTQSGINWAWKVAVHRKPVSHHNYLKPSDLQK